VILKNVRYLNIHYIARKLYIWTLSKNDYTAAMAHLILIFVNFIIRPAYYNLTCIRHPMAHSSRDIEFQPSAFLALLVIHKFNFRKW
jgi:hypothetical protein